MVDYKYSELYKQESIDKQLNIAFDGGNITNEDIHSEQFELTESLCSDSQLRFGSCEASMIKFRISNIFTPLKDKWLTVTETLNHNTDIPFQFGKYKVYSDTPTADRRYRDVVAYDKMYDIINTDLTDWYNSLFTTDDTEMKLKEFRDSLMNYLGVEQEDVTLVNDDMIIRKTIQPTQIAGRDVISAICEINGCFGHIGRDGKFHYVFLPKYTQGLYPSNDLYPKDDLYPRESSANKIDNSLYISCKYEDYLSQRITKLQIRQETNDIGKTYPDSNINDSDNVYAVQGNFLVYGKEQDELYEIAKNLFSVIADTEYRPYNAEIVGNPCIEVGDAIRINTKYQIVESYILKRTLKGVQGLRDSFSADGEEYLSENASGIESQIEQLRGKSNVLERNIDETVSKISDVEKGIQSAIKQTAESITSEVSATYETKTDAELTKRELQTSIEQTAESITSEVSKKYSTKDETQKAASTAESNAKSDTDEKLKSYSTTTEMNSAIKQSAESITSTVSEQIEEVKEYSNNSVIEAKKELNSSIEQTAESITSTVASTQSKWDVSAYEGKTIHYGYVDASASGIAAASGEYYVNVSTGHMWYARGNGAGGYIWYTQTWLSTTQKAVESKIEQTASEIVLKVDANGRIVEVSLTGDPKDGTTFTVDADNISLSATDVIDMLTDGDINLTGKNITITSDNFNVDSDGHMSCENADVTGDVNATSLNVLKTLRLFVGTTFDKDYADAVYADWGTTETGERVIIVYSNIEQFNKNISAPNIYSSGTISTNGTIYTAGDITSGKGTVTGQRIYSYGDAEIAGSVKGYSLYSTRAATAETSAKTNCYISTEGLISKTSTTSSKRFKDDISTDLCGELNPEKLYDVDIVQFKYKKDYFTNEDDIRYRKNLIGFIAEDVYEKYPIAADYHYDENNEVVVDTWNEQYLIPPMLKLIQEQKKEIDNMRLEIDELKKSVSFLMQKIGGGEDE